MSKNTKVNAAILIIGNEILSGRTQDTNTSTLAIWLSSIGVKVKEVRVIPDVEKIIVDGGIRRGTHVLKALAAGATACSFGKAFLFSLGAGGQQGVERLLQNMHDEIRRNMILMGCKSLKELDRNKIIYRS